MIVLGSILTMLPVRLHDVAQDGSLDRCFTAADRPPAPGDLERLTQCRAVNPDDPQLAVDAGDLLSAAGRAADAEAAYRAALALSPDNAAVRVKLATVLRNRGADDEARAQAEAALRLQPNNQAVEQLLDSVTRHDAR